MVRCGFAAGAVLLAAGVAAASASGWDVVKIEGHDYVSVESMKRFYNFTKLTRTGSSVVLEKAGLNGKGGVEMNLKLGGNECLMNGVKFVFTYSVAALGEKTYVSRMDLAKLIDPVLRPTYIRNAGDFRTVILDPGHGGKDAGATNALGTEATYNLKIAGMVKTLLAAQGFKVVMTRSSNVYLTLQERVDIANAIQENAIFICIHFNAGGPGARGIETFTLSPPGVSHYGSDVKASDSLMYAGNEHDSANIALATAVHGTVLRKLGENTFDRGIKHARFSVLSGVRHPAILLEGGFLTHPYEARMIENPKYQDALAKGVVEAIAKYQFAVRKNPSHQPAN